MIFQWTHRLVEIRAEVCIVQGSLSRTTGNRIDQTIIFGFMFELLLYRSNLHRSARICKKQKKKFGKSVNA